MTSARVPRRLHRDDENLSDPDDSGFKSWSPRSTATPFGGGSAMESYEYLGCYSHDWSTSSLMYAFHSSDMTVQVSAASVLVMAYLLC